MHLPTVAFPLFLQTHYIRNIVVVSCFSLIFIPSEKRHPLWSRFQENDPYIYISDYTFQVCLTCKLHNNFSKHEGEHFAFKDPF